MAASRPRARLCAVAAASRSLVIVLDQITKTLIIGSFQLGDSRTVTSFFNIVRVHNTGAAFSFLAGASGWQRWFFVGLGIVAAAFIVWMLRSHGGQTLFWLALVADPRRRARQRDRPTAARLRGRLHPAPPPGVVLPVVQRRRQRDQRRRGAADPRRTAPRAPQLAASPSKLRASEPRGLTFCTRDSNAASSFRGSPAGRAGAGCGPPACGAGSFITCDAAGNEGSRTIPSGMFAAATTVPDCGFGGLAGFLSQAASNAAASATVQEMVA